MKLLLKFLLFCAFITCYVFANPLIIDSDGNYISSERVSVANSGSLFQISGNLAIENTKDLDVSYVQIGLVPYGLDGQAMQDVNDFPSPLDGASAGFILIESFEIGDLTTKNFSRKIRINGDSLASVSLVVGASLSDGAKLFVRDLKLVPLNEEVANSDNSAHGTSVRDNPLYVDSLFGKNRGASLSTLEPIEDKNISDKADIFSLVDSGRVIYVNADFGSDNFEGLKKARGQADGPKRTIKAAVNSASAGDLIVLQQSSASYEVESIGTNSGKNLVIRADGKVTIRAKK